ncbi:MAG: alpha/beta hydrolase [Proteobacteria bacterium]|nr:alpha/beta hydrolase [Pseudomonadota bacterium]
MSDFTDGYWQSGDGLRLHYRDYPGRDDRPPLLCLPGLTRNGRDFEGLAARHAGEWRVICPDNRGRGDSAWSKNSESYNPMQYVADIGALCESLGITRFVAIGTSLGGLMTMIMAMLNPAQLAGALLNDVGPEIEAAGLERIRGYVGQARSFPTWMHAARALEEAQGAMFPDLAIADWLVLAKRSMVLGGSGRIVFDYDMKIAEPFARPGAETGGGEGASAPDLWPGLRALAGRPVALLRGELSDLLAPATFARMAEALPEAEAVTVPRVGHAPTLDEPAAVAAIERLLARIG